MAKLHKAGNVKDRVQELLLLALLPMLQHHQKEAIRERLDAMERGEVLPSRLIDHGEVERETAMWISDVPGAGGITEEEASDHNR